MTEIWRAIAGFEGRYEVSDLGRVRSLVKSARWGDEPRILRPGGNGSTGHLSVYLGAGHKCYVHRLILLAFEGEPPPNAEALHGDGDCANNRHTNLRWGTRRENLIDRTAHNADWSERHSAAMRRGWITRRGQVA